MADEDDGVMPIYEYRCPTCADLFEKRVSMSDESRQADCPSCGGRATKLLSTFAAIGMGGGSNVVAENCASPAGPMGGGCCGGGACGPM